MSTFEKIKSLLDSHGVQYEVARHEPTTRSIDTSEARGLPMHAGAKAIVLEGSKTGKNWLFVMPADLRVDNKKVAEIVGERTSFAADPEAVTGCVKGSVPPFGSVVGLKTYCDRRLADNGTIYFNAGSLTDSISMTYDEYIRIENPEIVDVSK